MTATETLIYPDAVAVCCLYGQAALIAGGDTDTVVNSRPSNDTRQVTLELVDSQIENIVVQRSTIKVEIRTGDGPLAQQQAHDLGQLFRGLLGAMAGTVQAGANIYKVADVQGLTSTPDTTTGNPGYTFHIDVWMRGGATTDPSTSVTVPDWLTSGVLSVVAGTNVTVDATDPQHPIVSATAGAGGSSYVHDQTLAATSWVVVHNLGMFPNVTTVDTAGTVINGGVHYDSNNQLTVTFTTAQSGKAYVS